MPTLSRLYEVHTLRRNTSVLLDTYLGPRKGQRVLKGLTQRGDGENIRAVLWFCDMRDSTAMADSMPREEFHENLNLFFDNIAGAVLEYGGEVLRFIGDAVLAIFPLSEAVGEAAPRSIAQASYDAIEAARIEGLCKTPDKPVLISEEFAKNYPEGLVSVGHHALRGVGGDREIFTLPAER